MRLLYLIGGIGLGMVLHGCTPNTDEYIPDFVRASKITYLSDLESHGQLDYWQTPEETEKLLTGDCEDSAIYLQHMWKKENIESTLVIGKENIKDKHYHAWLELIIKKYIYIADPTNKVFKKRSALNKDHYRGKKRM